MTTNDYEWQRMTKNYLKWLKKLKVIKKIMFDQRADRQSGL